MHTLYPHTDIDASSTYLFVRRQKLPLCSNYTASQQQKKKETNVANRANFLTCLQTPHLLMPKVLGELKERYAERPGGYTRVLRTEPKDQYSQAASAILELVDGPKDMRFYMTAAAVARDKELGRPHSDLTRKNMEKVTRYRENGEKEFNDLVGKVSKLGLGVEKKTNWWHTTDRDLKELERNEAERKEKMQKLKP